MLKPRAVIEFTLDTERYTWFRFHRWRRGIQIFMALLWFRFNIEFWFQD